MAAPLTICLEICPSAVAAPLPLARFRSGHQPLGPLLLRQAEAPARQKEVLSQPRQASQPLSAPQNPRIAEKTPSQAASLAPSFLSPDPVMDPSAGLAHATPRQHWEPELRIDVHLAWLVDKHLPAGWTPSFPSVDLMAHTST